MIVRTEKSVLFFIPWGERWIVGTTDTDFSGDRAEPAVTEEDVDVHPGQPRTGCWSRPLTRADVIAVYAGLRPLVSAQPGNGSKGAKPTTKLSREHVVDVPVPGLASVAGGKFTTYRLMARDVVDAAVAGLDREVPASVTDQMPLLGADGLAAVRAGAGRLAEDYNVSRAAVEHLLERYGTLAAEVLDLIRADPALARPLADGHPYLRAEVAYAVTARGRAARRGRAGAADPAVHRVGRLGRRGGRRGELRSWAGCSAGAGASAPPRHGATWSWSRPSRLAGRAPGACRCGAGRRGTGRPGAGRPGAGRRGAGRGWLAGAGRAGADWHRSGMSMDGREKPAADVPA